MPMFSSCACWGSLVYIRWFRGFREMSWRLSGLCEDRWHYWDDLLWLWCWVLLLRDRFFRYSLRWSSISGSIAWGAVTDESIIPWFHASGIDSSVIMEISWRFDRSLISTEWTHWDHSISIYYCLAVRFLCGMFLPPVINSINLEIKTRNNLGKVYFVLLVWWFY